MSQLSLTSNGSLLVFINVYRQFTQPDISAD